MRLQEGPVRVLEGLCGPFRVLWVMIRMRHRGLSN